MEDVKIVDFKSDYYNEVINLWNITGLNTPGRNDDLKIIQQTLSLGGALLLMFYKKQLVGTSWLTTDGRRLYLHHFGIHPDFQGKALSKILMNASFEFAQRLKLQIKLEVHKDNYKAKNLYKKAGFKYLGDYEVHIVRNLNDINKF